MGKPVIAITIGKKYYSRMVSEESIKKMNSFAEIRHTPTEDPADKKTMISLLEGADACITSWEVAQLDADIIAAATDLKAVVHMGGSVKRLVTDELFDRGVKVFGASPVLAETVAETALGFMIMGMKKAWEIAALVKEGEWRDFACWPPRELRGKTVGIIGASQVGRHVIKLLKPFNVNILVYDPYLSKEDEKLLNVNSTSLVDLASGSDVISLHAPVNDKTKQMLNGSVFEVMKDDTLIVNTARGSLIDEPALIKELSAGRFYAVLDVSDPEPPIKESPLRKLANVTLFPHFAGCIEDCSDMSLRAAEELRRYFAGETPLYEITREMFDRIS
jgi:phosphoglycerate dehydrogenase-like enzyme